MRKSRFILSVLAVLLTGLPIGSQGIDNTRALKVKAAYIYNFVKFTGWPSSAFKDKTSPITIGVLNETALFNILEKTVKNRSVRNRALKIRKLTFDFKTSGNPNAISKENLNDLKEMFKGCHLVFINKLNINILRSLLNDISGYPILTVSDSKDFARKGGKQ